MRILRWAAYNFWVFPVKSLLWQFPSLIVLSCKCHVFRVLFFRGLSDVLADLLHEWVIILMTLSCWISFVFLIICTGSWVLMPRIQNIALMNISSYTQFANSLVSSGSWSWSWWGLYLSFLWDWRFPPLLTFTECSNNTQATIARTYRVPAVGYRTVMTMPVAQLFAFVNVLTMGSVALRVTRIVNEGDPGMLEFCHLWS